MSWPSEHPSLLPYLHGVYFFSELDIHSVWSALDNVTEEALLCIPQHARESIVRGILTLLAQL